MSETQGPVTTRTINDILPEEMLGAIFEEHATLGWRAPAIDGRVCRLWRQIILSSPRAWAYLELEIDDDEHERPSCEELVRWLHRSSAVPLHIRIRTALRIRDGHRFLYPILDGVSTRIASLRTPRDDDATGPP
jgi:hypothetical protein